MSFCKCPVDIRNRNAFGDEWCSICGAPRFTKPPPAAEATAPTFPGPPKDWSGSSMFDCPHVVVIGDHINGSTGLVQCTACARLGTRLSGFVRWFDLPGPQTLPGPPAMRRSPMPQFDVTRQDTEEKVWSGEAENVGDALEKARQARPELTDTALVGTGAAVTGSSKR